MTVLFDILDHEWPIDEDGSHLPPSGMYVNLSNANAREFLAWLGLDSPEVHGEIRARELAPLLRRRLWPSNRARGDEGHGGATTSTPGHATFIDCGRPAGRLADRAQRLLALTEFAGDGTIVWA